MFSKCGNGMRVSTGDRIADCIGPVNGCFRCLLYNGLKDSLQPSEGFLNWIQRTVRYPNEGFDSVHEPQLSQAFSGQGIMGSCRHWPDVGTNLQD